MSNETTMATTSVPSNSQNISTSANLISSLMPIFLIMILFYFLIMRPNMKKENQRQKMINSIKKGDKVIAGGLIGVVHKVVNEKEIVLELAENVRVHILRAYITEVLDRKSLLGVMVNEVDKKNSRSKNEIENSNRME